MHLYMLYSDMSKCFHFCTDAGLLQKLFIGRERGKMDSIYFVLHP